MQSIAIITTCIEQWGGSEELWGRSIPGLQTAGIGVTVYKERIDRRHPRWAALAGSGVRLAELKTSQLNFLLRKTIRRLFGRYWSEGLQLRDRFVRRLREDRPALVVIAQGINFDGLDFAHACLDERIPYVIICQKAVEFFWPQPDQRPWMTEAYKGALTCFFVSRHNLRLTEEQFGARLDNAELIGNPVDRSGGLLPYPPVNGSYRLACVGRLFVLDKGQDILIRLLDRPKWRERPLQLSFVGSGVDREGLEAMSRLLGLTSIAFTGQVENMRDLWRDFHALVLPSRGEGLPLAVLEAMTAGRVVITTTAGGSQEVIEEGVTGFIGEPSIESFDQALERAWQRRADWETIGMEASKDLDRRLPREPAEKHFAEALIALLHGSKGQ
jgi:glycosyltransferase involved in cell wall biosynthesis